MNITVNVAPAVDALTAYAQRQVPFAAANALNRSADEVQVRLQQEIYLQMTVRTSQAGQFLERLIKRDRGLGDFAAKDRLSSSVRIAGPGNSIAAASILGRHIEGGPHATDSTDPFYIPEGTLRPRFGDVVPRNLYPAALGLVPRGSGAVRSRRRIRPRFAGGVQLIGKYRTFTIVKSGRTLGIFQRTGPLPGDVEMIWEFTEHLTLPPQFPFYTLAERVFVERWAPNFAGFLVSAIASAR